MRTTIQIAVIAGASALAALSTWQLVGPPQRTVPCNPAELKPGEICLADLPTDREIVWIDARPRSDWQRNGLPGSMLWNLEAGEDMNAMEAEAAMRIVTTPYAVVYCGDENCGTSHQIAELIRNLDLGAEVRVLFGGWSSLSQAGLTRDSPSQMK